MDLSQNNRIPARGKLSRAPRLAVGRPFVCPGQLDWAGKVATLRNAMKYSFRILLLPALMWCASPGPAAGSVIFKPGEKARYRVPGEEEMSGNAQELFS